MGYAMPCGCDTGTELDHGVLKTHAVHCGRLTMATKLAAEALHDNEVQMMDATYSHVQRRPNEALTARIEVSFIRLPPLFITSPSSVHFEAKLTISRLA